MTIHTKLRRVSLLTGLIVSAGLATVVVCSEPAHAVGDRQCHVTEYYSDAHHTQLVGQYSTCPGGTWGQRTEYSTTQVVSVGDHSPGSPGQGPSVPCEFRADPTCLSLPIARTTPKQGETNTETFRQ